jgi:hypothetical protein
MVSSAELASTRATREAEITPLLGPGSRGRERSDWHCMVVQVDDMHCSTGTGPPL